MLPIRLRHIAQCDGLPIGDASQRSQKSRRASLRTRRTTVIPPHVVRGGWGSQVATHVSGGRAGAALRCLPLRDATARYQYGKDRVPCHDVSSSRSVTRSKLLREPIRRARARNTTFDMTSGPDKPCVAKSRRPKHPRLRVRTGGIPPTLRLPPAPVLRHTAVHHFYV